MQHLHTGIINLKAIIVTMTLMFVCINTHAERFQYGNLWYNTTSESTCEVTTPSGSESPSSNNSYELEEVIIPEEVVYNGTSYRVTRIGDSAFEYSVLTRITIPASVTSISEKAFILCTALKEFNVDSKNTHFFSYDGVLFNKDITELVKYPSDKEGNLVIPQSVTRIGDYAFDSCPFTSIIIPNGVTSIGIGAFAYSHSLISITLPEGITRLENFTFNWCENLQQITLPNSITHIGFGTFADCRSLTKVDIPSNVTTIDGLAFVYSGLISAVIPYGTTTLGSQAFANCRALQNVTIPESITRLDDSQFYYCYSLTDVFDYASTPQNANKTTFQECYPTIHVRKGCKARYESSEPWSHFNIVEDLPAEGCFKSGNLYYQVTSENTCKLINPQDYNNLPQYELTEVTIPEVVTYNGKQYSVTAIEANAFSGNTTLKSVTIPTSVKTIGAVAFQECSALTDVIMQDGVTEIGVYAFLNCYVLKNIRFSESLTTIGEGAFFSCYELNSVNIPRGVTIIEPLTFLGCNSLSEITLPQGLEIIRNSAFYSCGFQSINIPESVTTIEDEAFQWCGYLSNVTIPKNVTRIGAGALAGCSSLQSIEVDAENRYFASVDGVLFDRDRSNLVAFPAGKSTTYVVPETTYRILESAFQSCNSIKSITFNNIITQIFSRAFYGCSSLTEIDLPRGLEHIGENAFTNCTSLTTAIIPASVWSLGQSVFYGCKNLAELYNYADSPQYINEYTFGDVNPNMVVHVRKGHKSEFTQNEHWNRFNIVEDLLPQGHFLYGDLVFNVTSENTCEVTFPGDHELDTPYNMTDVTIPELVVKDGKFYTVTGIDNCAFFNCENLRTVSLPSTIEYVEIKAFQDCTSLTTVNLPEALTTIGQDSFQNTALKDIVIPKNVWYIGWGAFGKCHSLASYSVAADNGYYTTVDGIIFTKDLKKLIAYPAGKSNARYDVPTTTHSIETNAFMGCKYLQQVIIPNNVKAMGVGIFYCCESLTGITLPDGIEYINISTFAECTSLKNVAIPESVKEIASMSFQNCTSLEQIVLPKGLTLIDNSAFEGCTALKSINLPEGLTKLGNLALADCESLTSIELPKSLTYIGENAFCCCRKIETIEIPDGVTSINWGAFQVCSSLKKVILPASVRTVDHYAFSNCIALSEIYIYATTAPTLGSSVFVNVNSSILNLHVRRGTKEQYQASKWKEFNIIDDIITLAFDEQEYHCGIGESFMPTIPDVDPDELDWTSSDSSILYIDPVYHLCLGRKDGVAYITVSQKVNPSNTATVKVLVGTAGIDDITLDDPDAEIYTIDGRRTDSRNAGISIIRSSDGKSRKTMKP